MSSQNLILKKIRENFGSFEEIWLFTQIFLLVMVLPLFFKFLSLTELMKLFTPRDLKVYKNIDIEKSKDKIVKFTDYILNCNFWKSKNFCLKRAIVLYYLLRNLGINVHICFGVKYNGNSPGKSSKDELTGHAWLLYNENIFLERNTEVTKTYKMTYSFPSEKAQKHSLSHRITQYS